MESHTYRGCYHLRSPDVGIECLQTAPQLHGRQHCPPGRFLASFRHAKQHQDSLSPKESQGTLVLLGQVLSQGKKCLAQALNLVKLQVVGEGRSLGDSGTKDGHQGMRTAWGATADRARCSAR